VSALGSQIDEVSVVYGYATADPSGDVWKKYKPDGPTIRNDLTEFEPYMGYWIQVEESLTWNPAD